MTKHFTATALLVTNDNPRRVLLGLHNKLGVWLPPGGHIDDRENPIEALIREVREECGMDIREKIRVTSVDERVHSIPVPDYFFEETIPARGDIAEHIHIDCVYVLFVGYVPPVFPVSEFSAMQWFTKEESMKLPTYPNIAHVILPDVFGRQKKDVHI